MAEIRPVKAGSILSSSISSMPPSVKTWMNPSVFLWTTNSTRETRHVSASRSGIYPGERVPHLGDRPSQYN